MLILLFVFQNQKVGQTISKTVISYNSTVTWIVAVLVLAWVLWIVVGRWRKTNAKRRTRAQSRDAALRKIVKTKDELSATWLRRGASRRIHGIGIGKLENGEFCIQIFLNSSDEEIFADPQGGDLPAEYKGVTIVPVAAPQAGFIAATDHYQQFSSEEYRRLIREKQDVIMGGISGANASLPGECGTIGYFCRKKSLFPRRSEIYLLSNSHVFADLRKRTVDEHDLIMQPSPGEPGPNRAIAALATLSHPSLENDTNLPNYVDAAIAKLWRQEPHKPVLPMIGTVTGFVEKGDVVVGEKVRKFGRTTGFTSGSVFSIYLDLWVKYDRTGESSFFKDQILVEPAAAGQKFVDKGDSGSLLVDGDNNATGLIFAGANGAIEIKEGPGAGTDTYMKTVSSYGVANPISEVMKRLGIELL